MAAILLQFLTKTVNAQESYESVMNRATEYRLANKCEAAEVLYDSILQNDGKNVDALVGRGLCKLRDKKWIPEAIDDFEKAITLTPDYVDAYIGKANALNRMGSFATALQTLRSCRDYCINDTAKVQYLAIGCWQLGYVGLARQLDRQFPPKPGRILIEQPNAVISEGTWCPLSNGEKWQFLSTTYIRKIRPDVNVNFQVGYHQRNAHNDFVGGAGLTLVASKRLLLSYEGAFSGTEGFAAIQRHKPLAKVSIFRSTSVGAGADFNKYSSGWVRLARFELEQSTGSLNTHYTVLGGIDNFDRIIFSHILTFTYLKSDRLAVGLGGAYGHESVERFGSTYVNELLRSVFAKIAIDAGSRIQFQSAIAGEWRKNDYFRTIITVAPLIRF